MADKITNDITLLFKTKLDEKSKQEVGKNLKNLLENAAIGFDEAETKRNLEPIIRMMKRLFDKAEIAFDADELLTMPSRQALQKMADMEVGQLQLAFDKALAKSGGIKIDFGDVDLSAMTEPLERLTQELSEIGERVASTTKKSVREIENTLTSLTKTKKLDETVGHIEKTLEAVNNPKHYTSQNSATKALEKARNAYTKSVESNDPWEKQYQHLLTFVSRYEAMTKKVKPLVDESRPEFKQLYEMLSPKAGAVKISLQHLVDLRQGNELTEYKNQPWARENTLKQVRDALKNGITVKEGSGDGGDTTPPWEDSHEDTKSKKPNTKIPAAEIPNVKAEKQARIETEKKAVAETAATKAAEQRRVEEEKIAEVLEKKVSATSDTSAFNQKLFDAIEKLSNDIEVAFKSMMNGDIDEDQLDDQLAELRSQFLKQFKFNGKQQHIDDYLAEKSDNMGDWNSKKIYGRLVKKLSPEDSSWSRIEAPIADNTTTQVIEEQNDKLKKQAEIIDLINSLIASKNQKEKFAYLNMQTGDASRYIEGQDDSVPVNEIKQLRKDDNRNFDSTLHTHPSKVAVPSPEDFKNQYIKNFESFKRNFILATDEIAEIDFSKLTEQQAKDISREYKERVDAREKEEVSLIDMGVESIDMDSMWTELERQLKAAFPALSDAIRAYIEDLRQTISADYAINTDLEDVRGVFDEKTVDHFQDQDTAIDIGGIAQQVFDQTSGAFDALQRMYRDILVQAIKDLGYDISQIFRTYSVQDFVQQVQSPNNIEQPISQKSELVDNTKQINSENNAIDEQNSKLKENISLKDEVNKRDIKASTNINVEDKPTNISDNAKLAGGVEIKPSINIEELRQLLNSITYNVKVAQDTEPAEDNKISIDEAALENVLNRITYNVKIAHDDTDKQSNKIAIDEGVLETTLRNVFSNILQSETEQTSVEPKNEPWALNDTLLSVKEVLGEIKSNTAKAESIEVAPVSTDVGNVLATENTLKVIKNAVKAIKSKINKGTSTKTSDGGEKKSGSGKKNAESYARSQYFPEKLKTQTMQLAKFRAQLMTTGKLTDDVDAQIYELLDGLKKVQSGPDFSAWSQKFQQLKTSVGITDIFDKAEGKDITASYQQLIEFQKTRNKLELQYEKAQEGTPLKQFYAEQLAQMDAVIAKQEEMLDNEEQEAKLAKMRVEQERKLGEIEAKAETKADKKRAADAKKLAKRQAMTGKAGSAIGRAEGVWLEAESLEQAKLPAGFKKQVEEYYDALDKLRLKHHEINTSEVVTDKQQNELIKQTAEVNRLTGEIGELVTEYQKLSGSNVDEANSRATILTGQSGLNEYETTLKQYVREITDGKGQIKSFNAETKTLTYTVKTGKNEFTEYTAAVRNLDHQLVSAQGTTKRTETFFEATARKMRELTSYFSGMAAFNRVGQELRRGIQYIREIDLALTELKKVTDETEETYDKFLDTAAKTGARLGTTISAVTEATATFAKLGYTMEQATKMAESAIVYKNVGDNIASTGDAADSIISTMKGFRLEVSESMAIVDKFNEVGNRFAITSQGIGEALRLSASALSEGGNSLDESIGLITAANEVVNDPSSVGKNKLADNKVAQNEETPEKENLVGKNM